MDTQPIGPQEGLSLTPRGDGRHPQGGSGQRQAPRLSAADQDSAHADPHGDPGLSGIAERLGATLDTAQDGPTFNRIVA